MRIFTTSHSMFWLVCMMSLV